MIELVRKNGITAPIVTCDVCGKRIKDARMGMVKFVNPTYKDGKVSYKINHKVTCDNREQCDWQELSHFLVWLLSNTGLKGEKLEEAKQRAELMEMII